MGKKYNKPPLSFEAQVNQLIHRGLHISNKSEAVRKLESISYYRLSAYWYPFKIKTDNDKISDSFRKGATFDQVIDLYEFDRHLRLLIIDAIERVEIAIRTHVTYELAHAYGGFAHIKPDNFHDKFDHPKWLDKINTETKRSNEKFIKHYKREYDDFPKIPIWMLTEVMSLGALSKLYQGIKNPEKKKVAARFNVHHKKLANWLHTLTYIRNLCAHHARLWNRELAIRPDMSKEKAWQAPFTPTNTRVFYILLVLKHLLNSISCGDQWYKDCNSLFEPIVSNPLWRNAMGFPESWENHPIWSDT